MKMKLNTGIAFGLLAAVVLSGCAGSGLIVKHHYTNGFHLNLGGGKKETKVASATPARKQPATPKTVAETGMGIEAKTSGIAQTQYLPELNPVQVNAPVKKAAARPAARPAVQRAAVAAAMADVKVNKATRAEVKQAVRAAKQTGMAGDKLLYVIVAIFIPFLAVLLYQNDLTSDFWIDLLLTLLFYVPGLVYALLVIFDKV